MDLIMNSNNPEMRWKLVKKSRSYRGLLGRSVNEEGKLGRVGGFSESDRDRFSEGSLGQSGSGKLESVPFKKRRHLLHEDSVSQSPSLSLEGTSEQDPLPGEDLSAGMDDDGRGEIPVAEDPSLKSISHDVPSAASPTDIFLRSNESDKLSDGNLAGEGESSERNKLDHISQGSCKRTEGETSPMAVSREHWDLNTVMDDWDKPFDPISGSKAVDDDMDVGKDEIQNPDSGKSTESCILKLKENNRDLEKGPKESIAILSLGVCRSIEPCNLKPDEKDLTVASAEECIKIVSKEPQQSCKPVEATGNFFNEAIEDKPSQGSVDQILHRDPHNETKDETDANNPCCTAAFEPNGSECGAFDISQKVSCFTNLGECEGSGNSAGNLARDDESKLSADQKDHTERCFAFGQSIVAQYVPNYEDYNEQLQESNGTGTSSDIIDGTLDHPNQHSNVSQACNIPINKDNLTANKEGYYSPSEDVELRGSYVHYWEKEYDGRDGVETHMTDCDLSELAGGVSESSCLIDKRNLVSERYHRAQQSDVGSVEHSLMQHSSLNDCGNIELAEKRSNIKSRFGVRQSTETTFGNNFSEQVNAWKGKSYLPDSKTEVMSYRAPNIPGEMLQPSPACHQTWRSPWQDGSYPCLKRGIYPGKAMGTRGSYRGVRDGGQRTYWTPRRPHTPQYQLPPTQADGRNKPRENTVGSVERIGDGQNFFDSRLTNNCTPKHFQGSIMRRPSFEREDFAGVQRRMPPVRRGVGNFRSRGHYTKHDNRDSVHLDDDIEAFMGFPHSSRRDRSLSPNPSRSSRLSLSRGMSGLRRESNSPRSQQACREHTMSRRQRRSPDYTTEARMERMKVPFFKQNFESDIREGHMITSSGCISSHDNYGSFDDSFSSEEHSRQRKSPIQVFRHPKRFANMPSPGQLKSNEYRGPSERFHFRASGTRHKLKSDFIDRRREGSSQMTHQRLPTAGDDGMRRIDNPPTDI